MLKAPPEPVDKTEADALAISTPPLQENNSINFPAAIPELSSLTLYKRWKRTTRYRYGYWSQWLLTLFDSNGANLMKREWTIGGQKQIRKLWQENWSCYSSSGMVLKSTAARSHGKLQQQNSRCGWAVSLEVVKEISRCRLEELLWKLCQYLEKQGSP